MRPADTSDDAWRYLMERLRQMTPQQKLWRVAELTALTHRLALEDIRRRYPHESERRWRVRLLARTVDAATIPESVRRALDWPQDDEPLAGAAGAPGAPGARGAAAGEPEAP